MVILQQQQLGQPAHAVVGSAFCEATGIHDGVDELHALLLVSHPHIDRVRLARERKLQLELTLRLLMCQQHYHAKLHT